MPTTRHSLRLFDSASLPRRIPRDSIGQPVSWRVFYHVLLYKRNDEKVSSGVFAKQRILFP